MSYTTTRDCEGGTVMDLKLKDRFLSLWHKYFNNAELPIAYWYADGPGDARAMKEGEGPRCIIGGLDMGHAVGSPGGKRYLGFRPTLLCSSGRFAFCCHS